MSRRLRGVLVVAGAVLTISCVRLHGPQDLRRQLGEQAGVRLDQETGLTITRSGMWLARRAVRWAAEDDGPTLRGIRRLEVGVYRVVADEPAAERPVPLDLARPAGWSPIAEVHAPDGDVLVAVREDAGRIAGMLIVVAEPDEWVLVRMRGDVEAMIEDAIRFGLEQAGRPELAEGAIAACVAAPAEPLSRHPAG